MRIPEEEISYGFKVVIIGAGGVGKTALFNRYCFNSFNMSTKMTIGISFHSAYIRIRLPNHQENTDKIVANSIFDFGGQDRFKPLIPKFLDGTNGALLVFDSVSFSSFQQLDYWYDQVEKYCGSNVPKILIGSKSDLLEKSSQGEIVSEDVINKFVIDKNLDGFFRTSALENYNVLKVFKKITKLMLLRHKIEAIIL